MMMLHLRTPRRHTNNWCIPTKTGATVKSRLKKFQFSTSQNYILEMGKPIKILNLAKQMIKLSGYNYENPTSSRYLEIKLQN